LPCEWEQGTTFQYNYVHQKTDRLRPDFNDVTANYPLTVTISESGNPASIRYDKGAVAFTGPEEVVSALNSAVDTNQIPAMSLQFLNGSVTKLNNQAAIVDATEESMGALQNMPKEVKERTFAMLRDPVLGQTLLLKEPNLFFAMHCIGLVKGERNVSSSEYPNPYGPPISGQSTVNWVAQDDEAGTMTMETHDRMDPESLKKSIPAIMQRLMPGVEMGPDMTEQLNKLPPFQRSMTGRIVYSTTDGFPVKLEYHQEIGSESHPLYMTETWTWTRVSPQQN